MTYGVLSVVLCAALLHATWNAFIKGGTDKTLNMVAVVLGHTPFAMLALIWVPLPHSDSLMWVVVSAFLHMGYQFFLLAAYRSGDFTQVYPLARGVGPLLVTLISMFFLGIVLTPPSLAGIGLMLLSMVSVWWVRRGLGQLAGRGFVMALVTGCFIAAYTLVDGYGARLSGSPVGYYAASAVINSALMIVILIGIKPALIGQAIACSKKLMLAGGGASFLAYAMIMWAFTQAPIPVVAALRETSILFALLIGVVHFKERMTGLLFACTLLMLVGVVLLKQ